MDFQKLYVYTVQKVVQSKVYKLKVYILGIITLKLDQFPYNVLRPL